MSRFGYVGSVSSGTMRPEDLIPEFHYVLGQLDKSKADSIEIPEDLDSEDADYALEKLFDALNDCAPEYMYFGANEGDGADYGFWVSWDSIDDDVHDGTLLKVSDLSDVPEDYTGMVLEVNDHGNATLYTVNKSIANEVWGIV